LFLHGADILLHYAGVKFKLVDNMASGDKPKDLSFFEHAAELRTRLLRMLGYTTAGTALAWTMRTPLLGLLRQPAEIGARQAGLEDLPFRIFEPAGGFILMMQIALVAGIVIASPLIFMELWLFIEPALARHEKRYVIWLLPAATGLFIGGAGFCYYVSPRAFAFFFNINQSIGVDVELTLQPYLYFLLRLLLVFGLAFELPLILMFLGLVGIIKSQHLLRWWRYAVVIIFIVAAVATPTTDPVTMLFMAGPLVLLYALSIGLVKLVEKRPGPTVEVEDTVPPPYDKLNVEPEDYDQ